MGRDLKISLCLLALILICGSVASLSICPVKGESTIYIRADGSVDPSDAPIRNTGNVTYTFTSDIFVSADGIVVERDNVVVDGDGYVLHGLGTGRQPEYAGIYLSGRVNVTIRNTQIKTFQRGIKLLSSSNNSIIGNNVTGAVYEAIRLFSSSDNNIAENNLDGNYYGIWLFSSSNNNRVSGNNITANIYDGIRLFSSSNNSISRNDITSNVLNGIMLYILSDNNSISENNMADNSIGILVSGSSGNMIIHNDFVENARQVYVEDSSQNIWDDVYPSGGNYWSDYLGTDGDSDGIGDTPYIIDSNNADNYPLMKPYNMQIPGDINQDGTVNIFDCVIVALAFGSMPSDPNWNIVADINGDEVVDIFDMVVVAVNFGETV